MKNHIMASLILIFIFGSAAIASPDHKPQQTPGTNIGIGVGVYDSTRINTSSSSKSFSGSTASGSGVGQANNGVSYNNDIPRQAPAPAPIIAMPPPNVNFSCSGASGVSATSPFGGISSALQDDDEFCQTMVMANEFAKAGSMQVACEMMTIYGREEMNNIVSKALKQAGKTCLDFK